MKYLSKTKRESAQRGGVFSDTRTGQPVPQTLAQPAFRGSQEQCSASFLTRKHHSQRGKWDLPPMHAWSRDP